MGCKLGPFHVLSVSSSAIATGGSQHIVEFAFLCLECCSTGWSSTHLSADASVLMETCACLFFSGGLNFRAQTSDSVLFCDFCSSPTAMSSFERKCTNIIK